MTGAQVFVVVILFALAVAAVFVASWNDHRDAYDRESEANLRRELRRHARQDNDQ